MRHFFIYIDRSIEPERSRASGVNRPRALDRPLRVRPPTDRTF